MNLTCISFQRTRNDNSKEEPEASRVKDTIVKERVSKEYKENEPSNYEQVDKKKGKESTNSRRMMSRMWYQDLKGNL